MEHNDPIYRTYVEILKRELVPAMGCTEPIAIAYCAAVAGRLLGGKPESVEILASGNIIKNVKSVIVPHTGGLKGMEAAAAAGILFGDASAMLEVISNVTPGQAAELPAAMERISFTVGALESDNVLDIQITAAGEGHTAMVRVANEHTNIVEMLRDGKPVKDAPGAAAVAEQADRTGGDSGKSGRDSAEAAHGSAGEAAPENAQENTQEPDYGLLTVAGIIDFAATAELSDVQECLERQIDLNTAIAREGMKTGYGARIGQVLARQDNSVQTMARAMAAAGSDARMNGCEMPVVINSGSGNQGLTASLPVIEYARYYSKTHEELLRALLVSNLTTLHLKSGIGRLSAYCGAVSAGAGAGAGIAWLMTRSEEVVCHTIVNALAVTSGIVCDGAKASCAAKIAMAVEAGTMGFDMYMQGNQFYGGDGLVSKGVEKTIANISSLGHDGMKETDRKIIEIMCPKETE